MNWGYKILVVYLVFISGILFMVFKSSGEKTDLVTSDYYAQELKYQDRIDEKDRTESLSAELKYEIKDDRLSILFPPDFKGKKIEGSITLYCPADKKKDIRQDFSIENEMAGIDLQPGNKGLYELQISWIADGKSYYYGKRIYL
ncbi:MAG: FixH family protein [Chitinophagaceae bacterium]|nr:FixH family protein [Chitinophagaceae bacterium]